MQLRLPFNGSYPITQRFDANPQNYQQWGLPGHEGNDWGLPSNTPLYAPHDATVLSAGVDQSSGYRWAVRLKWFTAEPDNPSQEWTLVLAHMLKDGTRVTAGQTVITGQLVGYSGNTGNSTGSHLHVTLKKIGAVTKSKNYPYNNYPPGIVDPLPYFGTPQPLPPLPEGQTRVKVVSPQGLNVRIAPSTKAKSLTQLGVGEVVIVTAILVEADGYLWHELATPQVSAKGVNIGAAWVAEHPLENNAYIVPV